MTNVVPIQQPALDTFEEFWQAYPHPRRVGKMLCKAKFNAIVGPGLKTRTLDRDSGNFVEIELSATPEEIIAGVKRYAERNRGTGTERYGFKEGGKFICHPATWLNQGRWLDD